MKTPRTLLAAAAAALLLLGPVACSDEDLPAGSGGFGDEPGTDADMGPGVQPSEGGNTGVQPSP